MRRGQTARFCLGAGGGVPCQEKPRGAGGRGCVVLQDWPASWVKTASRFTGSWLPLGAGKRLLIRLSMGSPPTRRKNKIGSNIPAVRALSRALCGDDQYDV